MKQLIIAAICLLVTHIAHAQVMDSAAKKTDIAAQKIIGFLKSRQPDSIYAMAGLSFKNKITMENFNAISTTQIFPLNDFSNVTYVSSVQGLNKYKVDGTPELQLLVGLDDMGMIETLLVQPFVGE